MVDKEKRELLAEMHEDSIVFDNPSFDNSIIGVSTNGNVIYDLDKMVDELSKEDDISAEEAYDFISYNTIRVMPYIKEGIAPIIMEMGL